MVSFQHDRPAKISSLCIFVVVVYQSFFYLYSYSYFIFGCGGSPLKPVGFLQLPQTGTTLCCSVWPPDCCDFSCWGAPALVTQASAAVVCRLSCSTAWGIFPDQGHQTCVPSIGRRISILSTVPPEKS